MMEWDSRMRNTHGVKVLKAAIPFLDVEEGASIDMEGLLQAIRPFAGKQEGQMLDMILQIFQMRRMFELVQVVQSMQQSMPTQESADMDLFSMMQAFLSPDMGTPFSENSTE